jgi:ribosomal protein S18 acetylase RimI-like enzyme
MEIQQLSHLEVNYDLNRGNNGYYTPRIFDVQTIDENGVISFQLREVNKVYKKIYDETPRERFNEIIKDGYSFGAFENGKLIAILICERRQWNNTLNIVNIVVSELFRGNGIGEKLVAKAKEVGKVAKCRLIELETQNTNFPGMKFYLKQGFQITGLNMKLYAQDSDQEVALFMSYEL